MDDVVVGDAVAPDAAVVTGELVAVEDELLLPEDEALARLHLELDGGDGVGRYDQHWHHGSDVGLGEEADGKGRYMDIGEERNVHTFIEDTHHKI